MDEELAFVVPGVVGRTSLRLPGMFSGAAILLDGAPAPTGAVRGAVLLPRTDGSAATARVKGGLFDLGPAVEVDGVTYPVGPPVPRWLAVLALLPMLLLYVGGMLGGLIGGFTVVFNQRIARAPLPTPVKVLSVLVASVAGAILFFVSALAVQFAIGPR